ncbi:MAG: LPS-assembly protein LptD [Rhizobiaceae bacterium]|nr:LPS-assembly protein LptD [Rhizobiaceae bacterium]
MVGGALPVPSVAQDFDVAAAVDSSSQMLIEADTLVYDNDNETVTAVGSVQIDYNGNRLVAQRVSYNRRTGRLVATGNVELIEPGGTKIYADEIDVTDDFASGFVNALRIETADKVYFAADSAEREGGTTTTFNRGVYTACEPCEDKPDKPPIWRIKARTIIWDGKKKTVRFLNSRFELFGLPIAYMPVFEVPDPTVKRKSGLLVPGFHYRSELGFGASVPYYFALSPTYDATVTARYYGKQGFLGEAEWRQKFNNGEYKVTVAGINQANPGEFWNGSVNGGTAANPNKFRAMVGTSGQFRINPRWTFGWDLLLQSDKNFSYTYSIQDYKDYVEQSKVYLTGLDGRNYFDVRALHFQVQEDRDSTFASARHEKQPWVLPSFDYTYTPELPLAGGELTVDVNAQVLKRDALDAQLATPRVAGVEGNNGRVTTEVEWKRSMVGDSGLVVTPLLNVRGDVGYTDVSAATVAGVDAMATTLGTTADLRSNYYRGMATAGLELRWPVLFSSPNSSHVIEPMAQVFARPNESYVGELAIPNEDAQSFVFDASTLFERDKFSGFDRIEGGTRVNVGLRSSSIFANGWTANGILGQSYHVAGQNSFAAPDLVNAGAFSGLETPKSDFVGLFGFATPFGLSSSVSARLDEQTLAVRRAEFRAGLVTDPVTITGKYAFIQKQPLYGFPTDRHETSFGATVKVHEFWSVFGSATYDFQSKVLVSDSIGFAYDDECFTYTMTLSESRNRVTRDTTRTVGVNISFRTIGDFGTDSTSGNVFVNR